MEIERKFLVARQPEPDEGSVRIEQGYLALTDGEGDAEVRLRRKGDELLLTVKGGEGRTRTEEEFRLDRARFESWATIMTWWSFTNTWRRTARP